MGQKPKIQYGSKAGSTGGTYIYMVGRVLVFGGPACRGDGEWKAVGSIASRSFLSVAPQRALRRRFARLHWLPGVVRLSPSENPLHQVDFDGGILRHGLEIFTFYRVVVVVQYCKAWKKAKTPERRNRTPACLRAL